MDALLYFELSQSMQKAEIAWPTDQKMNKRLKEKIRYYAKKPHIKQIRIGISQSGIQGVVDQWMKNLSLQDELSDIKIIYTCAHPKAVLTMERLMLNWAQADEQFGFKIVHDSPKIQEGALETKVKLGLNFVLYLAF